MTKVYCNTEKIISETKTNVESARDELNSAKSTARALSIPFDFEYVSYLRGLSTEINKVKKDYDKLIDWLGDSSIDFNKSVEDTEQDFNRLVIKEIPVDDSMIVKLY